MPSAITHINPTNNQSQDEQGGDATLAHFYNIADNSSPLSIRSMTVAYQQKPVLWDLDLDITPGTLTALVGPNGAGKSTCLKACLGLVPMSSGSVQFWGQRYKKVRQRVGYVPQRESVDWDFPVSVLDVVCMGRYRRIGWCLPVTRRHKEAARACLDQVGLADLAHRQISQLSGGQQQRVFLARALAQEADFYVMDEPFAGVDAATEQAILTVLRQLQQAQRTVMVVHHDLSTVAEYFDHVALLNMRLVASGPVATTLTPELLQQTYGNALSVSPAVSPSVSPSSPPPSPRAETLPS